MRFWVLLSLVAVCRAAPQQFAYSVNIPNDEAPWTQFQQRQQDTYSFGYQTPDGVRFERRDDQGNVQGSFGYVDANGEPVVWQFNSHPENGFTAEITSGEQVPRIAYYESQPAVAEAVLVNEEPVAEPASPLVRQALDTGRLTLDTSIPETPETLTYRVADDFSQSVGSVSELAAQLNAIPVAAVHDVRAPPRFREVIARDPVLEYTQDGQALVYRLVVPLQ